MRPDVGDHPDQNARFWRLDTFSDAIFAVAMTLLVFSFPISGLPGNLGQAEVQALLESLSPQFETFVISFLVVGAFWTGHHHIFDAIERYDHTLVWLNFFFLLFIVFIPFPKAVLVSAGSFWLPIAFYASTLAGAGFALTFVWLYASQNHRLIDVSVPMREIRLRTLMSIVVPSVFLFSILVAFYSPHLAQCFWLLSFVPQWAVARQLKKSAAVNSEAVSSQSRRCVARGSTATEVLDWKNLNGGQRRYAST
ncbi:MAG: TMEM175 family protein [Halobacteriota archaeon]